jgi:hypothetical protein
VFNYNGGSNCHVLYYHFQFTIAGAFRWPTLAINRAYWPCFAA